MWHFRTALLSEAAAIADLVNSAYRGESSRAGWTTEADILGGQRTDPEAIAAILSSSDSALLVAEDPSGSLVGTVHLERKPGAVAYLGMLTVRPDLQAHGLGKRLMARGEEYARSLWGARAVEMTVIHRRIELIDWYRRRGYHPTGETRPFPVGDPRFGLPRVESLEFIVLWKDLD